MRLLKVAMGLAVVAIAIGIFGWTSSPKEAAPDLQRYVVSKRVTFFKIHDPGGLTHYTRRETLEMERGVSVNQVYAMSKRVGNNWTSRSIMHAWPSEKINGEDTVSTVVFTTDLKWNQIWWVRFTHMGLDPFPDVSIDRLAIRRVAAP